MASDISHNSMLTQNEGGIAILTAPQGISRPPKAAPLPSRFLIWPETSLRTAPAATQEKQVAATAPCAKSVSFSTRRPLWRAWTAILALDLDTAAAHIAAAELALAAAPTQSSRRHRQEIEILRAAALACKDECLASLHAMQVIQQDELNPAGAGIAAILCRLGNWKLGDLTQLHNGQPANVNRALTCRRTLRAVFSLSIDAAAAFQRLRFPLARRLAIEAVAIAEATSGAASATAALPAAIAAQILYEEGYLDEANSMISSRLCAIKSGGMIESAIRAYTVFARIAARRNQTDLAFMILREAETLGEQRAWARLVAASVGQRLELCIQHGQIPDAEACLQRLQRLAAAHHQFGDSASRAAIQRFAEFGRYRVLLATGQARAVIASLRQAHHEAACSQDLLARFHLEICLAQALDAANERPEALFVLWDALKTGATVGLYQAFVDGGDWITHLLATLLEQPPEGGAELEVVMPFIRSLSDRRYNERGAPGQNAPFRNAPFRNASPRNAPFRNASPRNAPQRNKVSCRTSYLSARELGILQDISLGYSNKVIAQAKDVAPETVKSHVKHIFVKLGVGTRAQAVARGQALGLI